ncbi:MAG: hypothetical protein XE13_0011 [Proteiniphilum sp. 51_7]|nr:MAG: hypothetical protein XE13_0011 [Proteiniphilum sp. 51_7]
MKKERSSNSKKLNEQQDGQKYSSMNDFFGSFNDLCAANCAPKASQLYHAKTQTINQFL